MENESSTVEYYVLCSYCGNSYDVISTPITSEDWKQISNKVGKPFGWCGKCTGYSEQ